MWHADSADGHFRRKFQNRHFEAKGGCFLVAWRPGDGADGYVCRFDDVSLSWLWRDGDETVHFQWVNVAMRRRYHWVGGEEKREEGRATERRFGNVCFETTWTSPMIRCEQFWSEQLFMLTMMPWPNILIWKFWIWKANERSKIRNFSSCEKLQITVRHWQLRFGIGVRS